MAYCYNNKPIVDIIAWVAFFPITDKYFHRLE
jgi:hypothetical protein